MAKPLSLPPKFTVYYNGLPASGAKVYTYAAGTSTPIDTYSDDGGTLNANPVICDSRGECDIRLTAGTSYKFVVKTSADVTIYTVDNIIATDANNMTFTGSVDMSSATSVNYLNGSILVADLNQAVLDYIGVAGTSQYAIAGLTYAQGTDTVNDINIAPGSATDATNTKVITLAATIGKQSDVAWAVGGTAGTPVGALDTGVVGNNEYYIWLIMRSDTGIVDVLFSLSSTAPTMPTNYDYKRLIGWFLRSGGTVVAFSTVEVPGGGLTLDWNSPTLDVNLANTLSTTQRLDVVKVPTTFSVLAHLQATIYDTAAAGVAWVHYPGTADLTPSGTVAPLSNLVTEGFRRDLKQLIIRTDTSGRIAARCDAAVSPVDLYAVATIGFTMSRRS